jgi:DNA-binding MarR family transcriptional regulator
MTSKTLSIWHVKHFAYAVFMTRDTAERWTPAWMALVRTYARLWDQVEAQMRQDSGLTMPRYDVLMQLDLAGGRLGLTELASSIVLSASGLSKLLDRMEASGLIRREPDPSDARSTFARITPRGRSLVKKARDRHHDWLQHVFGDALDDRDVVDLTRIMQRIAERTPSS